MTTVRLAVQAFEFSNIGDMRQSEAVRAVLDAVQVWTCEPKPGERGDPPKLLPTIGDRARLVGALDLDWDDFRAFANQTWLHARRVEDRLKVRIWSALQRGNTGIECTESRDIVMLRADSARFGADLPKNLHLVLHEFRRHGRPLTWCLALASRSGAAR